MSAAAFDNSTLLAELLATTTHDALSRHVLPPFVPEFADGEAEVDLD